MYLVLYVLYFFHSRHKPIAQPMTQLTKQDFVLLKKQQEKSYLWTHSDVGNKVYELGKSGMSDNEIVFEFYNEWWNDLMEFSPESVCQYLKERWLTSQVRRAIKFVPIVRKAHDWIIDISENSEREDIKLKALTWIADKFDLEKEKDSLGGVTNNVFTMNNITQIIVE